MDSKALGKRMQDTRIAKGLTQAELAEMVDLTPKYLSNLECGFRMPRMGTFVDIANALNIDANTLLVDYLDLGPAIESTRVAILLEKLPADKQRSALRIFEAVITEFSENK